LDQTSDVRQILDLIADKWTALVILALSRGTKRYSELHRTIGGVSQKM
jgi:DNA-binding HxlR family transcriptional regulator